MVENTEKESEKKGAPLKVFLLFSFMFSAGAFFGVYIFFPWNMILSLINSSVEGVRVKEIGFHIPWGVKLREISINTNRFGFYGVIEKGKKLVGEHPTEIKIDEMRIIPHVTFPFALLFGEELPLSVDVWKNSTSLTSDLKISKGNFTPTEVSLNGVLYVKDLLYLFGLKGSGKIDLSSFFKVGKKFDLKNISGNVRAFSDNLVVELKNMGGLNIPVEGEFSFGKVEFISSIQNGVITINRLIMTGGDIQGDISGTLKLLSPFEDSELNLTLMIKTKIFPIPAQRFRIKGTFRNPKFEGI